MGLFDDVVNWVKTPSPEKQAALNNRAAWDRAGSYGERYPAQTSPGGHPPTAPNSPGSYPLTDSVSVTLDGSGNGVALWTPGLTGTGVRSAGGASPGRNSGLTASVTGVSVSVATNTKEAEATAYVSFGIQSTGQNDFQGQTQSGSTGDTCTINTGDLRPGDWITVKWQAGDPGQIATMKILGTINPPGV